MKAKTIQWLKRHPKLFVVSFVAGLGLVCLAFPIIPIIVGIWVVGSVAQAFVRKA